MCDFFCMFCLGIEYGIWGVEIIGGGYLGISVIKEVGRLVVIGGWIIFNFVIYKGILFFRFLDKESKKK